MKKSLFFIIFLAILNAESSQDSINDSNEVDSSFITPKEYGKSLYEYPRGIGCVKCHGNNGDERVLATYKHKGKEKEILVPRINNLDFQRFKKALSSDLGVMPRYRLVEEEINAIYLYITEKQRD